MGRVAIISAVVLVLGLGLYVLVAWIWRQVARAGDLTEEQEKAVLLRLYRAERILRDLTNEGADRLDTADLLSTSTRKKISEWLVQFNQLPHPVREQLRHYLEE